MKARSEATSLSGLRRNVNEALKDKSRRGGTLTMLIMYTHIYLSGIIQGNKTTNNQVILYRSKSNNDKHILNEYLSFDGRAYHYQDDIYTRFK